MLRNKEFREFTILFSFMAVILIAIGFIFNTAAGILMVISAAAFGTAFYLYTKARYDSIARISDQIDLVLHNEDRLDIDELEEGELSILYSEIKKMTMRIREQNEALKREREHLADSLADVAHQLRTPLTSVNLLLSLAANHPDAGERKMFVRETEELLLRMDWLITSLLKLSRLDAGVVAFQSEAADVHELIDSALRPFQIMIELHNLTVQIVLPTGMVIHGDQDWFSEAIQNILKNCLESAGENGKIEISGTDNPLYSEITIRDSGTGFQKEDLPHLFDRFYRGKNTNTAGYGIGLALARRIISRQGGSVTAKNHPEGGAVFFIRFPK